MRKIKFIFQKEYSHLLDSDQWPRILEESQSLGFDCFLFTILDDLGSEKLKEFLDKLSQLNFLVELEDNGTWHKERKELLINSDVNLFWFTLYGLSPETHDRIGGENDFQAVLEKLDYLGSKNLPVGLRYVLTKDNFDESFGFSAFLKRLKHQPEQTIIEEISPFKGKFFKKELLIGPEQLKLYLPYLKKHVLGFPDRPNSRIKIYSNYQNNEHYPFVSGEEMVVEGNGDVRSFPFFGSEAVGNVFSESLLKIHENLVEDLNRLTLEKAEKGLFLNWSSVVPDHPRLKETEFQDIDRVILPESFNILMTKKCNFRCDFCEFDCKPEDDEAIDIKDFEKLLKEAKQLGVKRVIFDGGEPLAHPEIKKAFKIAGDLGYDSTVLTNGWHFDQFLDDYKENHITSFIFGLFGASAETHDAIVGKEGAFDKCVAAIKLAKKLGYFTGLHPVLHPLNFPELDKFFNLAEQWRIDYLMTSAIVPLGRAQDNRNLILSEESKAEIPRIYQRHQNFISKIRFIGYRPQPGRHLNCKYLSRSGALGVYWDGSIALCSMVPLLKLPFLKIKEHSFIDCLIFMNKINHFFQQERNKEFPCWHPEIKEVHGCPYCHEKLSKDFEKYSQSREKDFLA